MEVKPKDSPPSAPEAGCNLQVIFEPISHQLMLPETNFGDQGTLAQKKKIIFDVKFSPDPLKSSSGAVSGAKLRHPKQI